MEYSLKIPIMEKAIFLREHLAIFNRENDDSTNLGHFQTK